MGNLLQVRTTSDHSVFLLSFVVEQEQLLPVSLVVVPSGIDTPKDSWFTGSMRRKEAALRSKEDMD